jgi:hypothetical protein
LVTASILYAVGYLVWSYHAWRNKLGLLPALDAQYFVAGLAPSVVLLVGYRLAGYLKRFFIYWKDFVDVQSTGAARILRLALWWAFWVFLVLMLLGPVGGVAILLTYYTVLGLAHRFAPGIYGAMVGFKFENVYDSIHNITGNVLKRVRVQNRSSASTNDALALIICLLGAFLFFYLQGHRDELTRRVLSRHPETIYTAVSLGLVVTLTLLPPSDDRYLRVLVEAYRAFWVYIATPLVIILVLAFYVTGIYPNLPQEFGGVKPRCAYLDVVRAKLSSDTLRDIISEDKVSDNQPVVRSGRVEVMFSGSSALYVRSGLGVHEIARDAIQAVSACD